MTDKITKPVQPSIPSVCKFLFRKGSDDDPCTEENMQPDEKLALLMRKHKVRVHDLVYSINRNTIPINVIRLLEEYDDGI